MNEIEKEVRDYLRCADILIARIQTGKPLSVKEAVLIQSYSVRVRSVLATFKGFESIAKSRAVAAPISKP